MNHDLRLPTRTNRIVPPVVTLTMVRPNPVPPDDPDDPYDLVDPNDPNLSFTAPPNPANMRPPEGGEHWTWYVLTGAEAGGMSSSWHITSVLTSGVPGQVFASYSSWAEAFAAYSRAYRAGAVRILPGRRIRRSRRRGPTSQRRTHPTPGASYANPYVIASSAPTTPQRPAQHTHSATPGTTRSNPYFVESSPAPVTPVRSTHVQSRHLAPVAPVTPATRSQRAAPGSAARLRAIEDALADPTPATPTPVRDDREVRSRIWALEEALEAFQERENSRLTPQTPTAENSSVTARLDSLEAAMNRILAREAECNPHQARRRHLEDGRDPTPTLSPRFLDGRDPTPTLSPRFLDGRDPLPSPSPRFFHAPDPTPPRLTFSAAPVAGSSTGPGTLAWEAAHAQAATTARDEESDDANSDDDSSDGSNEYEFYDFTAEEDLEVQELLMSYHEQYKAN